MMTVTIQNKKDLEWLGSGFLIVSFLDNLLANLHMEESSFLDCGLALAEITRRYPF